MTLLPRRLDPALLDHRRSATDSPRASDRPVSKHDDRSRHLCLIDRHGRGSSRDRTQSSISPGPPGTLTRCIRSRDSSRDRLARTVACTSPVGDRYEGHSAVHKRSGRPVSANRDRRDSRSTGSASTSPYTVGCPAEDRSVRQVRLTAPSRSTVVVGAVHMPSIRRPPQYPTSASFDGRPFDAERRQHRQNPLRVGDHPRR